MDKQFNVRIPEHTAGQLDWLLEKTGMTKTQLQILMIDRLYQEMSQEKERKKIEPNATGSGACQAEIG